MSAPIPPALLLTYLDLGPPVLVRTLGNELAVYLFSIEPSHRNNAGCTQARKTTRTAWMDNIKTWTGLPVDESIRMTEDRDKWRKYVNDVANRRIEDG